MSPPDIFEVHHPVFPISFIFGCSCPSKDSGWSRWLVTDSLITKVTATLFDYQSSFPFRKIPTGYLDSFSQERGESAMHCGWRPTVSQHILCSSNAFILVGDEEQEEGLHVTLFLLQLDVSPLYGCWFLQ